MLASGNIIWSKEKFSLLNLLHSSHSLKCPLLVKIVQGHYSSRTEDNYDPDEIFVFYGLGKQERVLAQNADNISISIPISHEHKLSVHLYDAEKVRHRVTLPLSSIMSILSPPVRVEFDPGVTSVFNAGSTSFNSNDFSPMLLKSSHHLEYVKCSRISQAGKVDMSALHILPTSLSLTCVVARALRDGPELGTALRDVQEEAAFLMEAPVDHKLDGICGYSDLVPKKDENYDFIEDIPPGPWGSRLGFKATSKGQIATPETIHPGDYTTLAGIDDPSKSPLYHEYACLAKSRVDVRREDQLDWKPKHPTRTEPHFSKIESGSGRFPQKMNTRDPKIDNMMSGGFIKELANKLSRSKLGTGTSMAMSLSEIPLPVSGVSCPAPKDFSASPKQPFPPPLLPKDHLRPTPTPPKNPLIPVRPRRLDSSSTSDQNNICMPSRPGRQESTPNCDQGSARHPSTMAHGDVSPQSPTPSVGVRDRRIRSLEDVPKDISSLSVQEVCDCLRLLKLDTYVQQFTDNLVDGRLLLTCTADDLKTEFGLSTFRARQVESFVKDGWRPKMNS